MDEGHGLEGCAVRRGSGERSGGVAPRVDAEAELADTFQLLPVSRYSSPRQSPPPCLRSDESPRRAVRQRLGRARRRPPGGQGRDTTMPKTNRSGDAKQSEIPSTLERSDEKAQRTYAQTYDSAMEQYGDEARANRTAFAALKRMHEKVGDHWEEKDEPGPSDDRAEVGGLDGPGSLPAASMPTGPRSTCSRSRGGWTSMAARR
ncbi:hypothetical protein GCM10025865_15840 [Paraoerskovia sediminicola]|uniref:ChaB protein n=1 Tax=Paraoerskovia sediminicola TaxID=1138587 RepID=A0ABM8G2I2_9CELL|nr:hypothetical protein GCM10025865_15840 [Paraoerskovia sediminicola]